MIISSVVDWKLQWAIKVVETLLGNEAFRYLSICFILFAFSVNSLVPLAPQFNVVKALWSVQSKNWQNQHCFGGKGGKCDQDAPKSNFTNKCVNTFAAHCSLQWRLMRGNIIKKRLASVWSICVHFHLFKVM